MVTHGNRLVSLTPACFSAAGPSHKPLRIFNTYFYLSLFSSTVGCCDAALHMIRQLGLEQVRG